MDIKDLGYHTCYMTIFQGAMEGISSQAEAITHYGSTDH